MSSDEVNLAIEVDADDAISSLEEYVKMLEEVEKASDIDLDDVIDSLEETGEGADSAIKPMEGLTDAFDNVVSTADGATSSLEAIVSSFEEGTSASEGLVSAVTEAGAGFEDFSGSADTGAGSLETLVASFEEGTAASETLNSGIAELPPVIDETASASTGLSTELENTGSAFTETSTTATETAGALEETNTAFIETSTGATETATALEEANTAFTESTTATTEAATANTEFAASTTELGTSIGDAVTAIEEENTLLGEFNTITTEAATASSEVAASQAELATSMEETGTAAATASSGLGELNTNVGDSIGFFGNATSSAFGLVSGYVRLERAQNFLQRTTVAVSRAQETLETAQAKLVKLQTSGSASATDLANAQRDVEQASGALEQKTGLLEVQQQNLNLRMTEFYATIGPNIIQTATGIVAGFANVPQAFTNIVGILGRLTGAFRGTTLSVGEYNAGVDQSIVANESYGGSIDNNSEGINDFGNDIGTTTGSLVTLTRTTGTASLGINDMGEKTRSAGSSLITLGRSAGIVGAIIGTAAVVIGLISNNTFGFRDALNSAGEAIGNTIPPLEGLLVTVQNFAVDVGIAGDDARAQVKKFEDLGNSFDKVTAQYRAMSAELKASSNEQAQQVGQNIDTMIQKSEEHNETIERTTQESADSWKRFTDALADEEWSAAVDAGIDHITTSWDGFLQAHGTRNEAIAAGWDATVSNMVLSFEGWVGQHKELSAEIEENQRASYEAMAGIAHDIFVNRIGGFFAEGVEQAKQNWQAGVSTWTQAFGTFIQSVEIGVDSIVTELNSIAGRVQNQAEELWHNSGLGQFFETAVTTAVTVGQQIAEALIPKGGTTPEERTTPQGAGVQTTPTPTAPKLQFDASSREAVTILKEIPPAANAANTSLGALDSANRANTASALQAAVAFNQQAVSLTSRFGGSLERTTPMVSRFEGTILRVPPLMSRFGNINEQVSARMVGFSDNLSNAISIMPGFGQALLDQRTGVAELSPEFQKYAESIQVADNHNITLTDSVLGSIPATEAAAGAIENLSGKRQKELGAALGTIGALGEDIDVRGMSNQQILDTAANLEYSAALIDKERESKVANTRASLEQQSKEKVTNDLLKAKAQSYIGLNGVLTDNVVANQAIIDEFQPLTQGMADQNVATQAVQHAYANMTAEKVKGIVALQKEAQALELNNILQEGSQRATIALEQAQTAGVKSGVDFANSQFTAQASLQGYRAALSEVISGNTEYGNSLGLTTKQLEQAVTFQNDVVAAQEAIIDVGAEVVHSQTVQIEAWRTMSQEQLNNLNATNQAREALIQLNSPMADNAANMQALNEAYIGGQQAASDYALGLRTTGAETAGYRKEVGILLAEQGKYNDLTGLTVDQLNRLMAAFLGTAEGARQTQEAVKGAFDEFVGMLKFDPEELHTKIDDAFKEVPDWIRDTMSRELEAGILAQADAERVGSQLVTNLGASIVGAWSSDDPFRLLGDFAQNTLDEVFGELDPDVAKILDPIKEKFQELEAMEGLPKTAENLQKLNGLFVETQIELENLASGFPPLKDEMDGLIDITPKMAGEMVQLDGGLANLARQGASVSLELGKVGQAAGEGQVPIVELTNAAGDVVGEFANVNGTLVPVNQGLSALVPASQLAGNALLGVGAFANAVVIRFGDVQEAVALTGTAFSLLTNIIGIGFGNVMAVLGAHVTTLNTYFLTTIPVALMATQNAWVLFSTTFIDNFGIMISLAGAHMTTLTTYFMTTFPLALMTTQNAWVLFSTTFIANFAIMIEQAGLHVLTLNTYFTTTIPLALMATQNAWVLFSTTFIINFAIMIEQAGLHVLTLNTYFTTTIPVALTTSQTAFTTFSTTVVNTIATMIAALGAHITTINTYFTQTIPQALTTGAQAFTSSTNAMSTSALTLRNNVQQTASDISSSFGEITSAASSMASSTTSSLNATSTAALTLRNNVDQLASDFEGAMDDMSSAVESFASAFSSSMQDVASSAEEATSAVEDLQSAIDSLQDKTVTITVQYKETGKPAGLQHGGSFIADSPTRIDGVRIAEHHKPELVTVIPLTNPNRDSDRTIDLGRLSEGPTTKGLQKGGNILTVPGGNRDMMRELIEEVRDMKDAMKHIRLQPPPLIMDGKRVDEIQQQRRYRRVGDFG